jgi:hypothetical protein
MNFETFMKNTLDFATEHWGILSTLLYEFLTRVIPTKKNLSLIDNGLKILGFILKNRKSGGGVHKILMIALLFISCNSVAQLNSTAKSFRSYNADSLTVRTEVSGLQLMYENVGALYYNNQSSKWRIFYDSAWHDLLGGSGGGGGTYTAGNGLTLSGTIFKSGGLLTDATTEFTGNGLGTNSFKIGDTNQEIGPFFVNSLDNTEINTFDVTGGTSIAQLKTTVDGYVSLNAAAEIQGLSPYYLFSTPGGLNSIKIDEVTDLGVTITSQNETIFGGGILAPDISNFALGFYPDYEVLYEESTGILGYGLRQTANNGITKTDEVNQLGGALIQNTTIDGVNTYSLTVDNLDDFTVIDDDATGNHLGSITISKPYSGSGYPNKHLVQLLAQDSSLSANSSAVYVNTHPTGGVTLSRSVLGVSNDFYVGSTRIRTVNNYAGSEIELENDGDIHLFADTDTDNINLTGRLISDQSLTSSSASTASGTISLSFLSAYTDYVQKIFVGSASFASAKVIDFIDDTNALSFDFHFEVSNVAGTVELPANCLMSDVNFNTTTQIWTPPSTGQYEMSGTYDGTNWKIKISGPYL